MAIVSFKDARLADVMNRAPPHRSLPSNLIRVLQRKLDYLEAAFALNDLRSPPANRLEALSGDRHGQYSIRVNDQYRLCFVWHDRGPAEVELVDYH